MGELRDGSNFVINTCEWPNGNHTIFATAKSQSGFEGVANGGVITYGRSVSSYVNVTFNNLISRFDFSQPFFEPALGQTQQVTATFAANCNWTLQIQDASSNAVRTVTGSGGSMEFDWDGTGDGETSIPDGVYHYVVSAQTNGAAPMSMMSSGGSGFSSSARASVSSVEDAIELWALPENGESFVPLALYPPRFDTNGFTIIQASQSQVKALTAAALALDQPTTTTKSAKLMVSGSDGGSSFQADGASPAYSGSSSQSTAGPSHLGKAAKRPASKLRSVESYYAVKLMESGFVVPAGVAVFPLILATMPRFPAWNYLGETCSPISVTKAPAKRRL